MSRYGLRTSSVREISQFPTQRPAWAGEVSDAQLVQSGSTTFTSGTGSFVSSTVLTSTVDADLVRVTFSGWSASAANRATLCNLTVGGSAYFQTGTQVAAIGGASPLVVWIPKRVVSGNAIVVAARSVVATAGTVTADLYATGTSTQFTNTLVVTGGNGTGSTMEGFSTTTQNVWHERVASTTQPFSAVAIVPSVHNSTIANNTGLWEVGVGPAGAEQVVAASYFETTTAELVRNPVGANCGMFRCRIPQGSRVAVRLSGIGSNPERYGVSVVGYST
jgi:hypothetical protein